MAVCCHHRCSWNSFFGRSHLESWGISETDFAILRCLAGWATCACSQDGSRSEMSVAKQTEQEKTNDLQRWVIHLWLCNCDLMSVRRWTGTFTFFTSTNLENWTALNTVRLVSNTATPPNAWIIYIMCVKCRVGKKNYHSPPEFKVWGAKGFFYIWATFVWTSTHIPGSVPSLEQIPCVRHGFVIHTTWKIKHHVWQTFFSLTSGTLSRVTRLSLSVSERQEIGRRCKLLLDAARVAFLTQLGFRACMVYFVTASVTPENVAILVLPGDDN